MDGAGSTAAGQQLRQPSQPAQLLVPDGKNGSWEGYRATGVGAWEWYLATGLLCLDQPSMALLDVDPDAYGGTARAAGSPPPQNTRMPRSPASVAASASSVLFPAPGGPLTSRTLPRPAPSAVSCPRSTST